MTTGFDVDKLRFAQRQRLTFIESVAFWEGRVDRPRVSGAFNVSENHVTKDFRLYKDAFPGNLQYDETARAYRPTRKFKPRIGKGSAEEYLSLLRAQAGGEEHQRRSDRDDGETGDRAGRCTGGWAGQHVCGLDTVRGRLERRSTTVCGSRP